MEPEAVNPEQVQTEQVKPEEIISEPDKTGQVEQPQVNIVHCCKCNREGWYPSVGSVESNVLKRIPKLINGQFMCLHCLDELSPKN